MKNILKKKKNLITIIVLAILILTLIIVNVVKAKNKKEEPKFEIGTIEKRTLTNSVNCSGSLKTEESKNVTSVLVGSKVTGVNVKVGDKVNIGDTLVTFDTETLNKTASDLASSISAAKQQSQIGVSGAERAVKDAENAKNTSLDQAKTAKDQAQAAYDKATQARNSSVPTLNANLASLQSEISTYAPLEQKYNQASDEVAKAQVAVNTAQDNYDKIVASLDPSLVGSNPEALQANAALDAAKATLVASQANLNNAKSAYMAIADRYASIQQQITSISTQISTLNQTAEQAKAAYEQAEKAYNSSTSNLDSAILSAQDAVATSKISSSTATLTLEEQLIATKKQLEDANLKSTVAGTVTAVNVKKGDNYQGGTLLTIEGVESFIVEANVDEYDVSDIEEGMDVTIKTDATREEELQGKVIFVAPSSNESAASVNTASGASSALGAIGGATTSGATYLVKIEILTPNDRLKLGMNAKASIITEKAENVLTVPYDAITEKENGKKVITVINDDDSQKEIEVKVGLESGYYSEIKSDKIKEGMKIVLPELNGNSTLDEILDSMGATGGIE